MSGDSRTDLVERRLRGDVRRGAPSRGARTLTAILPNGRIVWLRVGPPLAPAVAVNHLVQVAEQAAHWRREATRSQNAAIERLSRTMAADVERIGEARLDRARALRRRIVAGDNELDRRRARAAEQYRSRVEQQLRIERATVRRLRRRDLWDKILIATSFPLFAAYGQRGRPFGANNVTLALSLLIWLVGDEIVDALFGSQEASPYPLRDTDAWSYVAPLGNLLAGWWLLDDLQHQRFIAGRVAVPSGSFELLDAPPGSPERVYQYVVEVELSGLVAPEHFLDFQSFTGVPAVASIGSIRWSDEGVAAHARIGGLRANVDQGMLILSFTAIADAPVVDPPPSVLGLTPDGKEVRLSDGTTRPPREGDAYRLPDTGGKILETIDASKWKCP